MSPDAQVQQREHLVSAESADTATGLVWAAARGLGLLGRRLSEVGIDIDSAGGTQVATAAGWAAMLSAESGPLFGDSDELAAIPPTLCRALTLWRSGDDGQFAALCHEYGMVEHSAAVFGALVARIAVVIDVVAARHHADSDELVTQASLRWLHKGR